MALISEKEYNLAKMSKISNKHADNLFKDIENCNDALHALKKSLRLYLVQKAKEISSDSTEKVFDAVPIARQLIQSFAFEAQQVESLLAPNMISEVGCESKTGIDAALKESKDSNRKFSGVKEDNEKKFNGSLTSKMKTQDEDTEDDLGANKEEGNDEAIKDISLQPMNFNQLKCDSWICVPYGYFGFRYDNFRIANSTSYPNTGYEKGCISPPNVGYNGNGNPASIKSIDSSTFTVHSLFATPACAKNLKIKFEGLDSNSSVVVSETFTLESPDDTMQIILRGFSKLKEFRVSTTCASDAETHVAVDNIMIAHDG